VFFAGQALRLTSELAPSARANVTVEVTREPVGVVGLITPRNFPMAIPAGKVARALAYGNCVVLKPPEQTPACAHALGEIIARTSLPSGVFNLVMGGGPKSVLLVSCPDVMLLASPGLYLPGRSWRGRICTNSSLL
jgi:alpha-ketoglutaric semialdehyde dehydrogenase